MTHNALLGTNEDGAPLELSYEQRADHTYILGVTGKGKSTLMAHLALADMNHPDRHGLCVLDPHGTLVDDIVARVPEHRLDDVILIEPADSEHSFAFNLFAPMPDHVELDRYASELVGVFEATFGAEWRQVSDTMRNLTLTLLGRTSIAPLPNTDTPAIPAMDEIPHLLHLERIPPGHEKRPYWLQERQTYRSLFYRDLQDAGLINVLEFWKGMYDNLTPRLKWGTVQLLVERINRFLGNPLVARTLAQTENKLDFDEVLRDGRILLVNLSKSALGEENSRFLGSVLLARLTAAVFSRDPRQTANLRQFHLIIDEFHNLITTSFPKLFTDGRKFGVDVVVAHQKRGENLWAERTTAAAGNLICFELHGGDQRELAGEFDLTPPPGEDRYERVFEDEPVTDPEVDELPRTFVPLADTVRIRQVLADPLVPTIEDESCPVFIGSKKVVELATALCELEGIPAEWSQDAQRLASDFAHVFINGAWTNNDRVNWLKGHVAAIKVANGTVDWKIDGHSYPERDDKMMASLNSAALLLPRFLGKPFRNAILRLFQQEAEYRDAAGKHRLEAMLLAKQALRDAKVTRYYIPSEYVEAYVDSRGNEHEDRWPRHVRTAGQARGYADIQLEIANRLAHLGKYRAMFKLSNEDLTNRVARTLPLSKPTVSSQQLAHIRERTRTQHCRPRAEVDHELLTRYQARLRAVGYTEWTSGEPLPDIPLYVSDDEEE